MPLVPHVASGQIVASTWGNLVADHVVMRFTTAAQRTSQLTAPIVGQLTSRDDAPGVVEYWTGTAWAPTVPPRELAYAQITANKSITTSGAVGGDAVVSAPATVFDGSPVMLEFFSPAVTPAAIAAATVQLFLYEGATVLSTFAVVSNPAAGQCYVPVYAARRFTPTAGSHTYSVGAFRELGNGTVGAGPGGGLGQYVPAFIRITRAS
jgi:hypothetical protein